MKIVQIRNVPDELHRAMKARAATQGQSLSDYALAGLRRAMERPTRRELLDRVRAMPPVAGGQSAADAVRAERDSRATWLSRWPRPVRTSPSSRLTCAGRGCPATWALRGPSV